MLKFNQRTHTQVAVDTTLTLPYDKRTKGRLRVTLDDQRDAGLYLERGKLLREGDRIVSDCGVLVEIRAATEPVSSITCDDPLLFARACYHLGNRHVQLQIEAQELRYLHDHVLDDMLEKLGLTVQHAERPFNPEAGAYGGGHSHAHAHEQAHNPAHDHSHG